MKSEKEKDGRRNIKREQENKKRKEKERNRECGWERKNA